MERIWLAQYTPIERDTQTRGGGGWHTLVEHDIREKGGVAGTHALNVTHGREVVILVHPHRTGDADER